MMIIQPGVKVHLAPGFTDLRRGLDGLAVMVEQLLEQDPFSGHMFVFRGRRTDMIKILFWDGTGLCLFTKRLEDGCFPWPIASEQDVTVPISSAQLSILLEGVDWRRPERRWRPAAAG
jgi:transposase